jgi:type II secretory pathway pseudopilin PulG
LIETLIVLAIVSMVMALAMPGIQRITHQRVYSTCRRFIGTLRSIRNDAVLLNQVHRMGIDFDKKTWWVENQKEFRLLELEAAQTTKKRGKKEEEPPSNFALADKYSKKPTPFPDGVSIDAVLKEREGLKKEGIVYIHFFPNGYNEPAILYLNRAGADISESYSLLIRPTTGKVEFFRQYLKDFDSAA